MFCLVLYQIYYFKKRVLTKIFCADFINLQINLKGCILSHQIFSLTCLLVCCLSTGLYSFCSRAKFCKVYLCCFVAPLILFLCFLLSYSSLCNYISVQVLYCARLSPCKFKTKHIFLLVA